MSDSDVGGGATPEAELPYEYSRKGAWADFVGTFAGVMLIVVACFAILQGAAAVGNDNLYPEQADYLYDFDLGAWGWVHVVIGLLGIVVGVGILMRRGWAQLSGVLVAGLSMLTNFAFIPYYPFWAMTIIALNVLIVWALCTQFAHDA
jgi:hypothetical protein